MPHLDSRPFRRRAAFTLTELLTVIAIIGILAAILIPTINRVRESARSATCVSNLRQVSVSMKLYVIDHNGWLPAGSRDFDASLGDTGSGGSIPWTKALGDYLPRKGTNTTSPNNALFACPSTDYDGIAIEDLGSTYAATGAIISLNTSQTSTGTVKSPRRLNTIDEARQSSIPLIFEAQANKSGSFRNTAPSSFNWSGISGDVSAASVNQTTAADFRHGGKRMNIAYVDGSVRPIDFVGFKQFDIKTWSGLPR